MGRTDSGKKRDNPFDWLNESPDDYMKKAVQKSVAEYVEVNKIDLFADGKPNIKLKDISKIVAGRDPRWRGLSLDYINTSRHRAMKVLNDTLNNLLNNKKKLMELCLLIRGEIRADSVESSSSEHSVHAADLKNNETVIEEESEPKQS